MRPIQGGRSMLARRMVARRMVARRMVTQRRRALQRGACRTCPGLVLAPAYFA